MIGDDIEAQRDEEAVEHAVEDLPHRDVRVVPLDRSVRIDLWNVGQQSGSGLSCWRRTVNTSVTNGVQSGHTRRPTRAIEQGLHFVAESVHFFELLPNRIVIVVEVKCCRVVCLVWLSGGSESDLFLFGLVGAEQSVPDHDQCAIVLVDAIAVLSVMDAVLSGSVDDVLEWPQVGDDLRVQPYLVYERELHVHQKNGRRNDQRQWNRKELDSIWTALVSGPDL